MTITASKFFQVDQIRDIVTFQEDDFETCDEFKAAIADQIQSLYEQRIILQWQHKGFKIGNQWAIDIQKLNHYCLSHRCTLQQVGNKENNYMWRVAPMKQAVIASNAVF